MTLHERHFPVELARRELREFIAALENKHDLTHAEELMLLAEWLHDDLARTVKCARKGKK